jgi:endonuclease G
MTNHHVLPSQDAAADAKAIFNFEEDLAGGIRTTSTYEIDAASYVTSAALDCTIVQVKENANAPPLATWGALSARAPAPPRVHDPVTIIQHPLGAPKKIGILGNLVSQVEAPYIYYTTDTMRGSSGSPVLDTRWSLVALHRAAGKWSKEENRYLSNQGILISEIMTVAEFKPFLRGA